MSSHTLPLQRRQRYLKVGLTWVALATVRHLPGAIVNTMPQSGIAAFGSAVVSFGWSCDTNDGRGLVPGSAATPAVVGFESIVTGSVLTRLRPETVTLYLTTFAASAGGTV